MLAADSSFHQCSNSRLLAEAEAWEAIGRLVDARRVAVAAEVEHRSRPALGDEGIAFQQGRKDGAALVVELARIDVGEAKRRIGLGSALRPGTSLAGDLLPSRFPDLAAAVHQGEIGRSAARLVVEMLQSVRRPARRRRIWRRRRQRSPRPRAPSRRSSCGCTPRRGRRHWIPTVPSRASRSCAGSAA